MPGTAPTALPEAGSWTIDPLHSFVEFSVEHFTIAFARGIAAGPSGTITIAPNVTESSVEATIDASTVTTANAARDEKILGPDVLDVEQFKTIDFASRALRPLGGERYALDGELTLHGISKAITLDLVFNGVVEDTWGKTRLGLSASTELSRDDFGSGEWAHRALAAGGFMVPHEVKVNLEIEATKDEPES
jgi:polyisoprenoid-binding protein YceI